MGMLDHEVVNLKEGLKSLVHKAHFFSRCKVTTFFPNLQYLLYIFTNKNYTPLAYIRKKPYLCTRKKHYSI